MPQNFLTCDRDQPMLLPPDLRDWLPADHLAWFVIEAIEELDLEPFYAAYRADGHGAAAHEPKMMLTLLAYAYAVGERSSTSDRAPLSRGRRLPGDLRQPDPRPRDDRPLPGPPPGGARRPLRPGARPLRRGRDRRGRRCWRSTAPSSRPRRQTTPPEATSRSPREILAEAGRIDAAEDELYGEARGDELPEHLTSREGRRAWLREAKERLERERAADPEPVPKERAKRLELCRDRLVEDWRTERRANRDYEAYRARGVMRDGRRFGRPPDPHTPPAQARGQDQPHRPRLEEHEGLSRLRAGLQRTDGDHRAPDHRRRRDRARRPRLRPARPDGLSG